MNANYQMSSDQYSWTEHPFQFELFSPWVLERQKWQRTTKT